MGNSCSPGAVMKQLYVVKDSLYYVQNCAPTFYLGKEQVELHKSE